MSEEPSRKRPSHRRPSARAADQGSSQRAGKKKPAKNIAPRTPKLSDAGMHALAVGGARLRYRSKLRSALFEVIEAEGGLPAASAASAKEVVGRLWRHGRELGAPLEETRHWMLRYIDQVLCGHQFMLADPVQGGIARQRHVTDVAQLLVGWEKQLRRHLDAHPELKLSAAEAFGVPEDDED